MKNLIATGGALLFILALIISYAYHDGKRKVIAMEKIIADFGLITDYDCEQVADMLSIPIKDGYVEEYSFWDFVDAGGVEIEPAKIRGFIIRYRYYSVDSTFNK